MAKKLLFFCAGLLCLAPAARAQVPVGTVLGEDGASYPHAFVVMDNGDVYRSDYDRNTPGNPQGPWSLACNIFSAGGPTSRVVGVGSSPAKDGGLVLTAAGGTYRLCGGATCCAIFDGVIDHPPAQSFVAIGSNASINGRYIYAVTDQGCVYRASDHWEFAGCLPVGPTPATQATWGQLKTHYR
jgi:hypothetical protein